MSTSSAGPAIPFGDYEFLREQRVVDERLRDEVRQHQPQQGARERKDDDGRERPDVRPDVVKRAP